MSALFAVAFSCFPSPLSGLCHILSLTNIRYLLWPVCFLQLWEIIETSGWCEAQLLPGVSWLPVFILFTSLPHLSLCNPYFCSFSSGNFVFFQLLLYVFIYLNHLSSWPFTCASFLSCVGHFYLPLLHYAPFLCTHLCPTFLCLFLLSVICFPISFGLYCGFPEEKGTFWERFCFDVIEWTVVYPRKSVSVTL